MPAMALTLALPGVSMSIPNSPRLFVVVERPAFGPSMIRTAAAGTRPSIEDTVPLSATVFGDSGVAGEPLLLPHAAMQVAIDTATTAATNRLMDRPCRITLTPASSVLQFFAKNDWPSMNSVCSPTVRSPLIFNPPGGDIGDPPSAPKARRDHL